MWNRDSWLWWLGIASAVVLYLTQAAPPTEWGYQDWLKALAFAIATISGKLATSPLAGAPKNLGTVDPKKYVMLLALLPAVGLSACAKNVSFETNPVGATAHYATQVTRAVKGVQDTMISAEAAKFVSTAQTAAVVKVTVQIGVKAQELATALSELDRLPLADLGRKPLVAKVGIILQATNELVDALKLSDHFVSLSPEMRAKIHELLKEIGAVLIRLGTEVR